MWLVSSIAITSRLIGCVATTLLPASYCFPALAQSSLPLKATTSAPFATGAEVLAGFGFSALAGKRVGLITNQTGRVRGEHLADLLSRAPNVKLVAILAPEHGFRGDADAGARVSDAVDARTGVPIFSLYGASKKPMPYMLRNVDVLVFDIQDVGARFYTYISTMGLAMQAAAAARIPFVVLDRPNPLGGEYASGFVLERPLRSFVGQYPIPIVHGMTVGELARMIKGERWMRGLDSLDLRIVEMRGWQRSMRWPQTERTWLATSPGIPMFESALVYPGTGIVGETEVSVGRGTPTPFTMFGAPWLDAPDLVARLSGIGLAGVRFEAVDFTPSAISGAATRTRFEGKIVSGARVVVTDVARFEPLEVGMHVLAELIAQARIKRVGGMFPDLRMFHAIAGTKRLHSLLTSGSDGTAIVAAWQAEVAKFKAQRARYLLY